MRATLIVLLGVLIEITYGKFQSDNICLAQPNGARLSNPNDCGTYIVCEYNTITLMKCDKGTLFDSSLLVCNWADLVKCDNSVVYVPEPPTIPASTTTAAATTTTRWTTVALSAPTTTLPTRPPSTTTTTTTKPIITMPPASLYPLCASDGFYFLAHETNCEYYYICASGMLVLHSCGSGIYWNAAKNQCDYPANTKCYSTEPAAPSSVPTTTARATTTTPPVTTTTATPEPEAAAPSLPNCAGNRMFYPCLWDCKKYYICIGTNPILMNCPANYSWNSDISQCDSPVLAKCAKSY